MCYKVYLKCYGRETASDIPDCSAEHHRCNGQRKGTEQASLNMPIPMIQSSNIYVPFTAICV